LRVVTVINGPPGVKPCVGSRRPLPWTSSPSQAESHRGEGCVALGEQCCDRCSGVPGETPEYLALPTHAGLCVGGHNRSLVTRGTCMDKFQNLNIQENPGIGALNWRVFAENVSASPEGRNYVFDILESSVLTLRGRDSKLCYGIEQITVKVIRSHGEGGGSKEEPRSKD
ncbi:hypothetical protein ALC57_16490, partial [Trachymyrmex cornetzi]